MMPFNIIVEWIRQEKALGGESSEYAVLSTVSLEGDPRSRIVAIRTIEIETESLVFFTQQGTQKVAELLKNPNASFNFFLSKQQKQIILRGCATPLSLEENQSFWEEYPRERQLRFSTYGPISGQPIQNIAQLEATKQALFEKFQDKSIPMSESYYGFRFTPDIVFFYTLGTETFSESIRYVKTSEGWRSQLLSP